MFCKNKFVIVARVLYSPLPVKSNIPAGGGLKSGGDTLAGNGVQVESGGFRSGTVVRVPRSIAGGKFAASVPVSAHQSATDSTVRSFLSWSHSLGRPPVSPPVVLDSVPPLTWEDVRLLKLECTVGNINSKLDTFINKGRGVSGSSSKQVNQSFETRSLSSRDGSSLPKKETSKL